MKTRLLILLLLMCNVYSFAQTELINYRDWTRSNNDKVALVIGNSRYEHSNQLSYPAHDAKIIKSALQTQGYDVLEAYNLGLNSFKQVLRDLHAQLYNYNSLVIFYAGHGLEIKGTNYLVPIDANPIDELEVDYQCIKLDYLFALIDNPGMPKIVALDACRNNPFFGRGDTGMKRIYQQKKNTKIIFSTSVNTTVNDNNPFAEAFAQHIRDGGCIDDILRLTTNTVERKQSNQIIWEHGSLKEEICFGDHIDRSTIDSDRDGIVDANDRCPYEKGDFPSYGCPPGFIPEGMAFVEGGEFMMGCTSEQGDDCDKNEYPAHRVYVDDFFIKIHEVTNEEYAAFLNSEGNGSTNGEEWYEVYKYNRILRKTDGTYYPQEDWENRAVTFVTWYGAVAYCKWLSRTTGRKYRLPTEAEWEYAARGGKYKEGFKYSGSDNLNKVAHHSTGTEKVMTKLPNALGLYDMNGNLEEWCSDWYGDYSDTYERNPKGPGEGRFRVLRGGDWYDHHSDLRVTSRGSNGNYYTIGWLTGFRVVASLK